MPKSHQMILEVIPLTDINPAPYNPRLDLKPGDPDYEKLKKSILEFNMVEPLVYNKKSGNLVGGHQRLKVLQELGYTEVEVSVVNLSDTKEKALNLALNKISGDWDYPLLKDLLESLDTGIIDMEITGFDLGEIEDLMTQFHVPGEDDNYSRNIEAPIYEPKGDKPKLQELFDDTKSKKLIAEIKEADLSKEEKEFLIIAARRHTVLNYKRIADYYAHSDKDVQKLMEDSALIIIDFNRAIELGYVKLSEEVAKQYGVDYPDA